MTLRDAHGTMRDARVVCMPRARQRRCSRLLVGTHRGSRRAPRAAADPGRSAGATARAGVADRRAGRVVQRTAPIRCAGACAAEAATRPQWQRGFDVQAGSRHDLTCGDQTRRSPGKPTLRPRQRAHAAARGGRLSLRSHFVPVRAACEHAGRALVLDTIASPNELLGDRPAAAREGAVQDRWSTPRPA